MRRKKLEQEVLRGLEAKGVFDQPSEDGDMRTFTAKLLHGFSGKPEQEIRDLLVTPIADAMIPTLAGSLPELGVRGAITVSLVDDFKIDATVSRVPPYTATVSTSLVNFVASMMNTLFSGLEINLVDDAGHSQSRASGSRPIRLVARDIKRLLDGFVAEQEVALLDADAKGSRHTIPFRILHCAVSWVLGHELGHIVMSESRRRRTPAPFEGFATTLLERHFDGILTDSRFRDDLGPLNEQDRVRIFDRWLNEINADIMGASLACGYQKDHGPSKGLPGVEDFTMLAIQLGLMSQYMLATYSNTLDASRPLASHSHPPMDFRMYCVQRWIYQGNYLEAIEGVTSYVQKVYLEVARQAGVKGS